MVWTKITLTWGHSKIVGFFIIVTCFEFFNGNPDNGNIFIRHFSRQGSSLSPGAVVLMDLCRA